MSLTMRIMARAHPHEPRRTLILSVRIEQSGRITVRTVAVVVAEGVVAELGVVIVAEIGMVIAH